jgi:hypothetical protein
LRRRMVCAFLGFEDQEGQRIGCLLHPTRWAGQDIRSAVAFGLLPGFGCGAPDYYCLAAHWFAHASGSERQRLAQQMADLDWFSFSRAAAAYRPIGEARSPSDRSPCVRRPGDSSPIPLSRLDL